MTATPCISDTPTEILERILDFLHDDHATLYSASLVGRKWVHRSRHHLFCQATIKEYHPMSSREIDDNARTFLELAQSDHCTLLTSIRTVILVISTTELIDRVISVLARSKTISKVIYISLPRSTTISWSGAALPNIRELAFNFTLEVFSRDTWRFVMSFRNLRALSLYTLKLSIIAFPPDIPPAHFRNLRTLRLRLDPIDNPLFDWLQSLAGVNVPLETLDLQLFSPCHSGWGPVTVLNSIFREFSDTLTHLSLDMAYIFYLETPSFGDDVQILDLSALTHLRSIFLRTHDLGAVCDALGSLAASCALRTVAIHVPSWIYGEECPCAMPELLQRLYGVLEGRRFAGTEILEVYIPEGIDLDAAADKLSEWRAKGGLKLGHAKRFHHQCDTFEGLWPLTLWPQSD